MLSPLFFMRCGKVRYGTVNHMDDKINAKLEYEGDSMGNDRLMEIFMILLTEYEKKNERNSDNRGNALLNESL